jgi:hypothetical protein
MNSSIKNRLGRGAMFPALAISLLAAGGGALAFGGGAAVTAAGARTHGMAGPAGQAGTAAGGQAVAAGQSATAGQSAAGSSGGAAAGTVSAAMLAAGQTGPRSAVPWRQVGAGWELAEYSEASVYGVSHPKTGPTFLDLVDPRGGRYQLYRWARADYPQLVDWSGDKTRALLTDGAKAEQITLATGKVSQLKLPQQTELIGYTRPDGDNLLAAGTNIARYNLQGKRQVVLASGPSAESALESPDGTKVVVSASHGLRLVSNTGRLIRSLPAGYGQLGRIGCEPVRWWSSSTVLAACFEQGSTGVQRLYRVPVSGNPPTALTTRRDGSGADPLGDVNAWRLSSGLYLQAPIGCSSEQIVKQEASGAVKQVNIPGADGNDNHVLAAAGSRLLVQADLGCEGGASLLWFNPATRSVQMLIKAPKTVRGVIAAVPFYSQPGKA